MRIVAALLSAKVRTIVIVRAIFGAKTLLRGPGLNQRAVHSEVLVGHELLRLLVHLGEKSLGHIRAQQPIPVLGKHRMVPHRIVHAQAHEPAEQQVVVDLLELVCTVGLIIPDVFHWQPPLTILAATVLAVESVVFVGVHVKYREVAPMILSAVLGLLMVFIAYGRMVLQPIF